MEWLSLDWIVANWMPLLVAVVLGYLLGWLFTGRPAGRRAADSEARMVDAESKRRKAEGEASETKRKLDQERNAGLIAREDLEKSSARVSELEGELSALKEEQAALQAEAAALAALAEVEAEALEEVAVDAADVAAEFATVARTPEGITPPSPKDVALDEAFGRAVALQQELEERDAILAMRQAELETLKSELLTSNAARRELEARLVRAREDVAAELAVLASTMIKMKDDALVRSEARYAALASEAETLRSAAERATETAD
jgi:hypothetical protein